MPSRSHNRSCVHAPPNQREATISTSPPRAAAAACSGVTTGRSTPPAGPAPRGRPGRPRSCGSRWSSRSAGVLPSRIRRKLTRPGQPIAMRNSSTSAIGRTTGRRPSTSAPSSPRSTRSSSPRRPAAVHARRGPQGDVECLQGWSTTGTMYQRHRREARTRPGQQARARGV